MCCIFVRAVCFMHLSYSFVVLHLSFFFFSILYAPSLFFSPLRSLTSKIALIGISLSCDCVTYWLGFELREQKSILFILLGVKKTKPNTMNDLKQNIKYFSFARFFCHDLLLWKKQRNRRWQYTTKNLSSVHFFFSILHSLENYFHISRKISHSHIFYAYRTIIAQMCRI